MVAIIVAIIGAAATIAATIIMAKASSRHTVYLPPPIMQFGIAPIADTEPSLFQKIIRAIGLGTVGLLVFLGALLLTWSVPLWLGLGQASSAVAEGRMLSVTSFLAGALLLCVANWLRNLVDRLGKAESRLSDADD